MTPGMNESSQGSTPFEQAGVIESFPKGLADSSRSAVKAMQVKAHHVVSQNKHRYQEGGFDLDMAYISEKIVAIGFPTGDLISGLFGFFEGKYKVYNLCSEGLYEASRFEGKVACFPFDDHNCPPLHLITSFCKSACSWLKKHIENVVIVHCKAGMGSTGLMFFPTANEAIDCFNQKRCVDGRCMRRELRLHKCPYWIRPSITIMPNTLLQPEDFWISAPTKGIVVFALPGEPGLTEFVGNFKIHFHDRQGDFYCSNKFQPKISLRDEDDIFSDSDGEETSSPKSRQATNSGVGSTQSSRPSNITTEQMRSLAHGTKQMLLGS
ncbi:hypothetical protein P3X46_018739 [Hevea brasiliensis]|uniref:Phosphatase tensin-type domain-containing protein n=1 Tax=Hevea brasiliensis TaxID=3981 RepID=A0ABQ9LVN0_HEVBR|nr:hypothetical protein P3X46_018739 [Hevea brasiliensis]